MEKAALTAAILGKGEGGAAVHLGEKISRFLAHLAGATAQVAGVMIKNPLLWPRGVERVLACKKG